MKNEPPIVAIKKTLIDNVFEVSMKTYIGWANFYDDGKPNAAVIIVFRTEDEAKATATRLRYDRVIVETHKVRIEVIDGNEG